ncbi:MAG: thiamine diphosphokinase [Alphaproteobacteria bacterium]
MANETTSGLNFNRKIHLLLALHTVIIPTEIAEPKILKKALLFLNGELGKKHPDFADYHQIFATDGAYNKLRDIVPFHTVIGDFDSSQNIAAHIATIHTPNQDYTDFEKALGYLIEQGFTSVDVYNAHGGDGDHYLGNLSTAMKLNERIHIRFFSDDQIYYYVNRTTIINDIQDKMVSLFPFPQCVVSTQGLKWNVDKAAFTLGGNLGIRNLAIAEHIKITCHKGGYFLFIGN